MRCSTIDWPCQRLAFIHMYTVNENQKLHAQSREEPRTKCVRLKLECTIPFFQFSIHQKS